MIVFDGERIIASVIDDFLGDRLLATHRVDGDNRAQRVHHVKKLRNRGDLVGLRVDRDLAERQAMLGSPCTDDMKCVRLVDVGVGTSRSLAIDLDEDRTFFVSVLSGQAADSAKQCRLKLIGLDQRKHPANRVVRRDSCGKINKLRDPVFFIDTELLNVGRSVGSGDGTSDDRKRESNQADESQRPPTRGSSTDSKRS